jgi:hypothetical protein
MRVLLLLVAMGSLGLRQLLGSFGDPVNEEKSRSLPPS